MDESALQPKNSRVEKLSPANRERHSPPDRNSYMEVYRPCENQLMTHKAGARTCVKQTKTVRFAAWIYQGVAMARLLSIAGLTAILLSGCSVPEHVATMMSGDASDYEIGSLTPKGQLLEMAAEANSKTQPPPL